MRTTTMLAALPTEIVEHIAFYYVCPQVLGPPVPLTSLLLSCRDIYNKLSGARHLYARVFKQKFSFSAIRRRGFEPRAGEWAWQLRRWTEVLNGVRRRRRKPRDQAYLDNPQTEDPGVQETMYALWIMCLEDDGCNRLQMQFAGVYEWVEGWIRTEMYRELEKGWPLANAGNSCAMWVFWYLTTKARLMEESEDQKESLIELVLPFLTVPFRYPSTFAPANHFRLPLRSSVLSSSGPMSIPTPHGPFPIYLHPNRHTWVTPHFERWTPLCTPLASDAAKLVYFSRRETMLFNVPNFYPRNREDHRNRVRVRLAAESNGQVDDSEVERVFRSELPKPTQEDFEELNAGLLGGDMVEPPSSFRKGGGTPLPRAFDPWDNVRRVLPSIVSDSDLEAAERILGGEFDESACSSRRWDTDWWRLRLARSAWISTGAESEEHEEGVSGSQEAEANDDEPDVAADDEEVTEVEKDEDIESDMKRSPTMFTGYPQKGAVYKPGALTGLWTGRMVIPSETHLRALLLPPQPPAPMPPAFVPDPDPNNPNVAPGPDGGPIPNPNNPNPALPDFAPEHQPQEAGHRPATFTEDTLRLVAVPLYVRLEEYAVFSGGKSVPCANDTSDMDVDGEGRNGDQSGASASGSGSGLSADAYEEASYDQGIRDAWFPPNTTLSTQGDRVLVSVPPGPDNIRARTNTEKFTYVKVGKNGLGSASESDTEQGIASPGRTIGSEPEARSKRQPGTFHDPDTCPGCLAREQALLAARLAPEAEVEVEADESSEDEDIELPPFVPSPETIPPCDGIRDVVLTGSTDPRHAAAWGKWTWRGRVRSWDGLVGLVRSADIGLGSTGGAGKIFFYGTLVGGRNLIGTWRLAHEDPRIPAYEGAFTLGRKDES